MRINRKELTLYCQRSYESKTIESVKSESVRLSDSSNLIFFLNNKNNQFLLIFAKNNKKNFKKKGSDENHRCVWGCMRGGVWGVGCGMGGVTKQSFHQEPPRRSVRLIPQNP
jgi:hypothetical protein